MTDRFRSSATALASTASSLPGSSPPPRNETAAVTEATHARPTGIPETPDATAIDDGGVDFTDLGLPEPLLRAITEEGYTAPTPIQARAIPVLRSGRDLLGQAQTGTGKTAAFALPLLCNIDDRLRAVQALVLVPTRELAIQVASAIHTYAKHLSQISVLPVYGGESMARQLTRLARGVHVVIGTPGRVLDHLRRESLKLDQVRLAVLDEADEMLRMGFIEDVEEILRHTPSVRQTALLSATLPAEIQRVARHHLRNPERITIEAATRTVEATTQRFVVVAEHYKVAALVRLLEFHQPEAALVFVRTRAGADELAEALHSFGQPAEALHSDLSQAQRATVLQQLRDRKLRVVVATDVAARGLDIDHISHVINFDLPGDLETYVHRIGRTGRAGRSGEAILLVTPYQRGRLRTLERYTNSAVLPLAIPKRSEVLEKRSERVLSTLSESLQSGIPATFQTLAEKLAGAGTYDPAALLAAALQELCLWPRNATSERRDESPEDLSPPQSQQQSRGAPFRDARDSRERSAPSSRPTRYGAPREALPGDSSDRPRPRPDRMSQGPTARLLLAVGHDHGVRPQDIVGAIANEAGIPGRAIGQIEIRGSSSSAEIPLELSQAVCAAMRRATIRGQFARPRLLSGAPSQRSRMPH